MTRTTLTLKGLEDQLEQVAAAGRDVDAAAQAALQAGGEVLLDGMMRRAPEATGNLKRHIVMDGPHQDGNYHYVVVGVVGADAETARYGNAQEYGTKSMPAHSYIRTTMDGDKARARAAMRAALKEAGTI